MATPFGAVHLAGGIVVSFDPVLRVKTLPGRQAGDDGV
jgi:hypothetical protein